MIFKVDDTLLLDMLDEQYAVATFELINANRQYLREWLPWVDNMRSIENFENYIRLTKKQFDKGTDYGFVILYNGDVVGRIGLHYIDHQNSMAALGYWLAAAFTGKGIITKACTTLISFAFTQLHLNRIELKCATQNIKSKAIAERIGFKQEGILRQAEFVNNRFVDLYIFSLLKTEWQH
jgi:ribosomal-protein-serine acetyltransferase